MPTCRTCPAEIEWVLTEKGNMMPLDVEPNPDGNIVKVGVRRKLPLVHVLSKGQGEMFLSDERYTSHFATCPNSKRHRKGAS